MGSRYSSAFCLSRKFFIAALVLALAACGGGGGGGGDDSAAAPPSSPPPAAGDPNPPPPAAQNLQAVLAACPNMYLVNDSVPCMEGVYEGKTTDTGAYCALHYDSDGMAYYLADSQTLRVNLSATSSGAVFEKKAAGNAAGFTVTWYLGIASGRDLDVFYQSDKEPASANGLLIKPEKTGVSPCLLTTQISSATGSTTTANLLGRNWQSPQLLNGSGAMGFLPDRPAFDVGMADDGRAFVTFRQPDVSGRMAVHVVEGRPGAAGQNPSWSSPVILDSSAPLLAGDFLPRIAVSSTGHAVVMWMTELPCDADTYESSPAGKTCRYVYASRRLASATAWEPALRVRASPPMKAQDYYPRINARGDIVLVFSSFVTAGSSTTASTLAIRHAVDSAYRIVRLNGFWSNASSAKPLAEAIFANLDDNDNLFVAGLSSATFGGVAHVRSTTALAPSVLNKDPDLDDVHVYDLAVGSGFAAYTTKYESGPYEPAKPERLTLYSPTSQQWFAPYDVMRYMMWGDSILVATDDPVGQILLYSGCKVTALRGGTWGYTRALPEYCGGDRDGGIYAFNRDGDYVGINWAGMDGQWGYYSYVQDKMLKGAPGTGTSMGGDFVLGTPAELFDPQTTQLLLAKGGVALAVTTNTFTTLPSAADPVGIRGNGAQKLWAVYLK